MSEKSKKRKDTEATCKLPGCDRQVFATKGGKVFEYCCKSHGKLHSSSSSSSSTSSNSSTSISNSTSSSTTSSTFSHVSSPSTSTFKKKKLDIKYEDTKFPPKPRTPWNETWAKIKEVIPPARTPVKLASKEERYSQLVKYMLSGRTTDEQVDIAFKKLQDNSLSIENILEIDQKDLEHLFVGVNSADDKANRIKRTSKILQTKYDCDVPSTTAELLELPGVGPKIATMVLRYCWGINSGISVDVHIHRVCNRLGWVKTKEPNDTKKALEEFVPKDEWSDIGALYKFGKLTCTAFSPKCSSCPVSQFCPSSTV